MPTETEYNTLRTEILNEMEMQTNLRIAMCTISVTILLFGIERKSPFLCLAVFAVLIPFRLLILNKQFGILRISAYIIVEFESRYTRLKWESTVSGVEGSNTYRGHFISKFGYFIASEYGILAIVAYYFLLQNKSTVYILIPIVLPAITFYIDVAFRNEKIRNSFIEAFKEKR